MNDTERLDLLVKLLERYDLDRCNRGYAFFPNNIKYSSPVETFFPRNAEIMSITYRFYGTVRDLLDAVKEKL